MTVEVGQLGPTPAGSVMLDIGGSQGALVLIARADMVGVEVEISACKNDSTRTHVAIRERQGPNGVSYAAIFPSLPAGEYTLWKQCGEPASTVKVIGGEITQLVWPVSASSTNQ